jgi:hypothetical protein
MKGHPNAIGRDTCPTLLCSCLSCTMLLNFFLITLFLTFLSFLYRPYTSNCHIHRFLCHFTNIWISVYFPFLLDLHNLVTISFQSFFVLVVQLFYLQWFGFSCLNSLVSFPSIMVRLVFFLPQHHLLVMHLLLVDFLLYLFCPWYHMLTCWFCGSLLVSRCLGERTSMVD